jgi:hypothetical protein
MKAGNGAAEMEQEQMKGINQKNLSVYHLYLGEGKHAKIPREHLNILEHMDYVFECTCGCHILFAYEKYLCPSDEHNELMAFLETLGERIGAKIETYEDGIDHQQTKT